MHVRAASAADAQDNFHISAENQVALKVTNVYPV
ncbi:hypothetical protein SEA_NICEHOUSE_17 [Rhodococcus phage NiceHouse]|nr:hypothetical protein SEA_NICEHOUSE_17 [Rhodococcus phage NiceHouse]